MRWVVLFFCAGCAGDPCDSFPNQTCISLEVRGPALQLDQIGLHSLGGFQLSDGRSPAQPKPFELPVELAVVPGGAFEGAFELEVLGLFQDRAVARDTVHSTVKAREHLRLIADLLPLIDDNSRDLAGLDLTGSDLTESQAHDLAGVDLAGADLATVDLTSPGGWQIESIPSQVGVIKSIWGTSSSNVYAVNIEGVILHSTGDGMWSVQRPSSGSTNDSYAVLGGSGADDIWAGGQILNCSGTCAGLLLHSTGDGTWTPVALPSELNKSLSVMAIGAVSKTDVYLAVWGGSNTFLHSTNGVDWSPENVSGLSFNQLVDSFYLAAPNDLFAASNSGGVFHSTGDGNWSILDNLPSCGGAFLVGTSSANVYAACDKISNNEDAVLHYPGSGTFVQQFIDDNSFEGKAVGLTGSSGTDLYAGFELAIKHSSGDGHWSNEVLPLTSGFAINTVWAAPDGQVFAGTDDVILHKR